MVVSARAELLFWFPDACIEGQEYADKFQSVLELYDALTNPIWVEWLIARRHPLNPEQAALYQMMAHLLAMAYGIYENSSNPNGPAYNHDSCVALRLIVGQSFRQELWNMHHHFEAIEAAKAEGVSV